jgi:DNA polymerase III subunit epsilon
MLPLPTFAFVDLETTGTSAQADRITEIGIVRVDDDGANLRVTEWSSLVDPEVPIPPAIQALTGITDAMVASAPSFSTIANDVRALLDGCVFVAHNARFDYGFLKHAFARLERTFSARVLCTVRLSRRLFPDADGGHGLDALIARHAIPVTERHRALGDARAIWSFVERLYRDDVRDRVDGAIRRILRVPSLPPQLAPDAIDVLPDAAGVYLFYGDNPLPLYIGKSINLRERVAAHFSQDWRSETDLRLSREIRRIEHERTAGELGALLREAVLVKSLLPAYNRALRRKEEAGIARVREGVPKFIPALGIERQALDGAYGPFASRASFRAALRAVCAEHRLCARRLGLERGATGPCFARQLRRCNGVCIGEEPAQEHDARMAAALAPLAIPAWPLSGAGCVREASVDDERVDVHVFRDWCWLGTARNDGELGELVSCPPRASFDLDVTRLLLRRYRAGTLGLRPLGSTS